MIKNRVYIYIYIMIQKIRNLDPVYYVLYCIFIIFLKYVYFVFVSPDADTLSRTHQNLTLSSKKRYLVRYRVNQVPGMNPPWKKVVHCAK